MVLMMESPSMTKQIGRFSRWLSLVFCLAFSIAALAADTSTRPRIGLALAGGSAKGLAHVGVLKWLQEHRIPVDVVAGTSMGGLVGGLYASGYDAPEMVAFIRSINWPEALLPDPPYPDLNFRRKQDRQDFPNQLIMGFKGGLRLPSSLSSGQGVGLLLSRFTSPYPNLKSFDELPTPFRCVAVDLKDGKQVIFQSGALFDALRSTMSIPGVFTPWHVGDHVLVDGGVLNNLPVDVLKTMEPEFIIAVDLQSLAIEKKAPSSLLGVAARTLDIIIARNETRNLALANVILAPDVSSFKSSDFQRAEELEKVGYDTAALKAKELEPLAVSEKAWAAYLRTRQERRQRPPANPQFLEASRDAKPERAEVQKELSALLGKGFTTQRLDVRLTEITGWGRYASADYRAAQRSGAEGYSVLLHEKDYGPPFLNVIILLNGSQADGLQFGVGGRLTYLDFKGPFSEWRTDFGIGTLNQISTEYYWRIKGTRYFLAPRLFYEDSVFNVYKQGMKYLSIDYQQPGLGADVGYAAGRSDELRLGYQLGRLNLSQNTGPLVFPNTTGNQSLVSAKWEHEGTNHAAVPTKGLRVATQGSYVFASPLAKTGYPQLEGLFTWAHPLKPRYTFLTTVSGGVAGNNQIPVPPFSLGGTFRLSALGRNQLYGSRYYYGNLTLLRSLTSPDAVSFVRLYLGGRYEIGNAFMQHQSANPYQDGTVGVVGDSFIGVFFFGVSYGEGGQFKVLFRMGRLF
jgi:NTE family protein